MQFIRNGLPQCGPNGPADFDLAGKRRHRAVFTDVQPSRDVLRQLFLVKSARGSGLLHGLRVFCDGEDCDSRPKEFEKITARQLEMVDRPGGNFVALGLGNEFLCNVAHRPRSRMLLAAWPTASMIRGCVPHRHTLPCKNCTMSAEAGLGFP